MRRDYQDRHQVALKIDKRLSSHALLVRELPLGRCFDELSRFSGVVATPANPAEYRACQQKRRFGRSRCMTSCSHDVSSKNGENRLQNPSKVDRSRSYGVRRGAQVDRSWSFGVSRSAKVDRSGSIEARLVELARRAGTRRFQLRRPVGDVGQLSF